MTITTSGPSGNESTPSFTPNSKNRISGAFPKSCAKDSERPARVRERKRIDKRAPQNPCG